MWNQIILFRSSLESNLRPLTLTSAPNCSFFALRGGGSHPKSSSSGPSNRTRNRFFLIFSSFAGSSKYFFTISPVRFASSSSIKIARCCQSMKQELGRWYAVATITLEFFEQMNGWYWVFFRVVFFLKGWNWWNYAYLLLSARILYNKPFTNGSL